MRHGATSTQRKTAGLRSTITFKGLLIGVPVLAVVALGAWFGVERYTARSAFCGGSCHTMTEQYVAWKTNKHFAKNNEQSIEAGCVDCHFLPGEKYGPESQMGRAAAFGGLFVRQERAAADPAGGQGRGLFAVRLSR